MEQRLQLKSASANESEDVEGSFSSLLVDLNDSEDIGQVTSVSQLSDVQPTDWAFQALQSLVERYGCIAGYPDGTFRGNRSATRYEMAAALNACLDNISDKFATKEDLEAVKALQRRNFKQSLQHSEVVWMVWKRGPIHLKHNSFLPPPS